MSRNIAAFSVLSLAACFLIGCDVEPTQRRSVNAGAFGVDLGEASAPAPGASTTTASDATLPPPSGQSSPPAPAQSSPPEPAQNPPPTPEPERVVADAGVGVKGRSLGGSYLESVFKSKFYIEQKAEFLKIQHAMQLYEAQYGEKPKSHEEFMEKIVKFNQIRLPRLPDGERYVYDPKTGELMVERPR